MITQLIITHKSGHSKSVLCEEYSPRELNAIWSFYDSHIDYIVEEK